MSRKRRKSDDTVVDAVKLINESFVRQLSRKKTMALKRYDKINHDRKARVGVERKYKEETKTQEIQGDRGK